MTLDQLSAAATQGEAMSYAKSIVEAVEQGCNYEDKCLAVRDWLLRYRTGQLVAVQADDATVERVARSLAPHLEGGREFDQMPKDRAQLRQWTAQGMCLINDATQDDATWLAQEAIKAAKGTGDE